MREYKYLIKICEYVRESFSQILVLLFICCIILYGIVVATAIVSVVNDNNIADKLL